MLTAGETASERERKEIAVADARDALQHIRPLPGFRMHPKEKPLRKLLAVTAAAVALAAAVPTPAHANIGPDTWTRAWAWDGPGTGQINQTESSVQTLDCNTIVARETRTDRATRYHRVENAWPAPNQAAQYPAQQRIITVLKPRQGGWNVVHSWTPGHPHMDLSRVVWVPPCADDLNPLTAPRF